MKKKIFSIFMVFTLCFVSVNQAYADAGSLIIAGGSIAGVTAGAITGPAVVAVFCAMMAFGMNVELTKASEEAGLTKTEFLKVKLQQYCDQANLSYNTFNKYVLEQANVFQNGAISIGSQAGKLIERFCNWLFETDSVETGDSSVIIVDGVSYPVIEPGQTEIIATFSSSTDTDSRQLFYAYNTGDYPIAITFINTGDAYRLLMFSKEAFQNIEFTWTQLNTTKNHIDGTGTVNSYSGVINNVYYNNPYNMFFRYIDVQSVNTTLPIYEGTIESFLNSVHTGIGTGTADVITGDKSIYDVNKNVLNPADGETIVINPNITIPVPQDKDVTIDVNEYIDAIQDLIDGVADDIITAIDDATGVPVVIDWDPTQDWDPTIEKEDDTELPDDEDKTPVVDDDTIPSDFDVEPLKFDLKGFFPFCLPFDVADMIGMLQADPVAPSYTVDWDIPFIEQNLTFTVDLEPYDNVAETCRKMEMLLFCVGLAVVTRSLFIRS